MINFRIMEKVDSLLDIENYNEAESILLYWVNDSISSHKIDDLFFYQNELIGLYRKTNNKEACIKFIEKTIEIIEENNLTHNVGGATGYINIATGYKHFGYINEAISYYYKALEIYNLELDDNDFRKGTLYNNLAISLMDNNELDKAEEYYNKALEIMDKHHHAILEKAMTYLSLADLTEKKKGLVDGSDEISNYCELAIDCFNHDDLNLDGRYLFVAKKCINSFEYFGYFMFKNELQERIDYIEKELHIK